MNNQILSLSKKFRELQTKHEELAAQLKEIDTQWSEVETSLLEAMVEEGVKSFDIDGMGKFIMRVTPILSSTAATKPLALSYLRKTKNDSIIKEDVPSQTLTAFWKTHLEELIKLRVENQGLDEVSARKDAIEYLKKQAGVSAFEKRDISLRAK